MTGPIVFDGSILGAGPPTGVGLAFLHALTAYAEIAELHAVLLLPATAAAPRIAGIEIVRTTSIVGPIARWLRLDGELRRLRAQVFHAPIAALPLRAPCPMIATIHDLPWRADTSLAEPGMRLRHRLAVRIATARAAAVIVPSHATARDLRAEVREPAAEILVVPHGVPLPASTGPVEDRGGAFLVIGDDRPRKNVARVLRAHARARELCTDLPGLERIGPTTRYVDEATKHALLRASRALLHVALHEGFGLPIVEAFGHGTPVLCSDRKSMPEVAAGAALLVDPEDEAAIAAAIVRIHTDVELRTHLALGGRDRAEQLTPERVARQWHALHRRLAR